VSSDLRYEKGGKANVTNAVVVNLDSVGSAFASSIFLSKYGRRKRKCMLSRKFEINNYNTDKYSLKSKNVTVTYTTMLPTFHVMLLHDSYRKYGDTALTVGLGW